MAVRTLDSEHLKEFCKRNGITFMAVFGSFARGDFDPESDVDLLVRFSGRKSLIDIVRLERELSESLGKKVELLTEASISPYLKERIQRELRVIYE